MADDFSSIINGAIESSRIRVKELEVAALRIAQLLDTERKFLSEMAPQPLTPEDVGKFVELRDGQIAQVVETGGDGVVMVLSGNRSVTKSGHCNASRSYSPADVLRFADVSRYPTALLADAVSERLRRDGSNE